LLNWLRFGAFLMTARRETHPASASRAGFGTAPPPSIHGQPLPPSDPARSARSSDRIERSRCVDQHSRRAPLFPIGGARASIRQRIVKERLRFPSSMILRWDRPPLESWSGMLSFLDDTRSIATGSLFPNQPEEDIPSRPFPRCPMRLLFASIPSELDPSKSATLATRAVLEPLAGRGRNCRVLSSGGARHFGTSRPRSQAELVPGRSRGSLWTSTVSGSRSLRPAAPTAHPTRACRGVPGPGRSKKEVYGVSGTPIQRSLSAFADFA
jgi:hypothetical protein